MDPIHTDRSAPVPQTPTDAELPPEARLVGQALSLLDLVAVDMWRRVGGRVPLDDLASAGREAIVPLVRRYDPARSRLEPYLNRRLRWAMHDALRRDTHCRVRGLRACEPAADRGARPRATLSPGHAAEPTAAVDTPREPAGRPTHEAIVVCVGDMQDAPDSTRNPEKALLRGREASRLWAQVARLPERQRRLVEEHYRLGVRIDELAVELGISKSRASRLHRQALARLGARLADGHLRRARPRRRRRGAPESPSTPAIGPRAEP